MDGHYVVVVGRNENGDVKVRLCGPFKSQVEANAWEDGLNLVAGMLREDLIAFPSKPFFGGGQPAIISPKITHEEIMVELIDG